MEPQPDAVSKPPASKDYVFEWRQLTKPPHQRYALHLRDGVVMATIERLGATCWTVKIMDGAPTSLTSFSAAVAFVETAVAEELSEDLDQGARLIFPPVRDV